MNSLTIGRSVGLLVEPWAEIEAWTILNNNDSWDLNYDLTYYP